MHFCERRFEALAAYVIHREKGECLRQWYAVCAGVQKFNVRLDFAKNGSENYLPKRPLGDCPLGQHRRPPCQ